MFYIFNRITGVCMTKCNTIKRARREILRLDIAFGLPTHYIRLANGRECVLILGD